MARKSYKIKLSFHNEIPITLNGYRYFFDFYLYNPCVSISLRTFSGRR